MENLNLNCVSLTDEIKAQNIATLEKMAKKNGYAKENLVRCFTACHPTEIVNLLLEITRRALRIVGWTESQVSKFTKIASSGTQRDMLEYCYVVQSQSSEYAEDNKVVAYQINVILDGIELEALRKRTLEVAYKGLDDRLKNILQTKLEENPSILTKLIESLTE
jgi:hypothetical protein